MKILLQKISLLVIGVVSSMVVSAQEIRVSVALSNSPIGAQVIANGSGYDVSSFFGNSINLASYLPVTVTVTNVSSSATPLVALLPTLSGTGASDFELNTSNYDGVLEASESTTFTITLSPSATNGVKTVYISIGTNSTSNFTLVGTDKYYSGYITYNLANITTSLTKASDIGLSLYPNPSNDGKMQVTANNVTVERIVVSNVAGQTEEFTSTEFKTSLKGLLLVRLYTDKGVVSEKVIVQE